MHKFRFSPRQTKNLIVSLAMATIIAIPVLAQPLGLTSTSTPAVADTNGSQETVLSTQETVTPQPLETSLDSLELDFNRSRNEADVEALGDPADADVEDIDALAAAGGDIDGNELMDDVELAEPVTDPTVQALQAEPANEPADPIADVAAHTVYITRNGVNLRAEPDTNSTALARLGMGVRLTATGEMPGWKRVKDAGGREGFVSDEFLSKEMVFVPANDTVYVLKNGVNLRQSPSAGSASLGMLGINTKLTRTGIGDEWTRVSTATGKVGYIASSFLTTTAPAAPTAAPTPKPTAAPAKPTAAPTPKPAAATTSTSPAINKVVDTAYSMLGVRYVYGSESRSGVDCSGLILYCYRQAGISVPRTSSDYASFGTAVSYANMRPGDVIAMDTRLGDGRTSITHVGLYVGGGNMIHASSSIGRVVKANVANYLNYAKLITIRRIVR